MRLVADGMRFPEGPLVLPDGSLLVVEIVGQCLTRIGPDGAKERVAELPGGPNGAALGPDGTVYVCNNGGFVMTELGTRLVPGREPGGVTEPDGFEGGSVQRVDLDTGEVETLYTECDGHRLRAPNDLVFDGAGGFWFTDHGKIRLRDRDRGGLYYAKADGSSIRAAIFPLDAPNGVGLSPDGGEVYVAETYTARLWAWEVTDPGQAVRAAVYGTGGRLLAGLGGLQYLDSLAVDGEGNVCVATIGNPGVTVIAPDGSRVEHVPLPAEFHDPIPTNICFGGPDLRTAYVTLSATGRLVACDWPVAGLRLANQA